MADVYGGCEFAISALSSPKATNGILRNRNLQPVELGTVDVSYGTWHDSVKLFARRKPRCMLEEFHRCPLNRRGWPLQEKILASAVLHYGRDQLMWECNTLHICSETGETELDTETAIRLSRSMAGSMQKTLGLWEVIIQEFTKRKVTYATDRLLAVSGIASKLRQDRMLSGRYAAGLWEGNLDFQILWTSMYPTTNVYNRAAETTQHISTWSWAHRTNVVAMETKGKPTSALSRPARFYFRNHADDESSQSGTTVQNCAITLQGFVQTISLTAINIDCWPSLISSNLAQPGLPGRGSGLYTDHWELGPGPFFCIRVLEDGQEVSYPGGTVIYYLVVEEDKSSKAEAFRHLGLVCTRVGVLYLQEVPLDLFIRPYTDVFCRNGKPLLTDGKWTDIVLI